MFSSSYRNTSGSFGELEKAVETLACGSCSHSISRSPKLPLVFLLFHRNMENMFSSNISKTSARVSSGFQTRETFETTRPQAEWFCFRALGNLMKPEARVFEITSPTKKIGLNYHLNKFFQFNYYI